MKILYISELDHSSKFGGAVMEKRTLEVLHKFHDIEDANVPAQERNKINKIKDLFFSSIPSLYSRNEVNRLKKCIKSTDAEVVFVESSKLGVLVKYAKELGKKVLVFFHNCEYLFYKAQGGSIYLKNIYKQEKLTLEYADQCFILNERDKKSLEETYHMTIKNYLYSPVTFTDRVSEEDINKMKQKQKGSKGVFLGSYCTLNYEGIKWFADNVADFIDATIDIVGLDFEKCDTIKNPNIHIIGTVDEVASYLMDADFIISPIFSGSGMKVKTCEALMYGKKIFASDEALIGYSSSSTAFVRCNTKEEYITAINNYVKSEEKPFVQAARDLFVEEYSTKRFENDLKEALERIYL